MKREKDCFTRGTESLDDGQNGLCDSRLDRVGQLAELVRLKTVHGIGSGDAWRYLQARADRDALAQALAPTIVEIGFPDCPDGRTISRLCTTAKRLLNDLMEDWDPARATLFQVLPYSPALDAEDECEAMIPLIYEYDRCLKAFYAALHSLGKPEAAWRAAIAILIDSEAPVFWDLDGEQHSFKGLFTCDKFAEPDDERFDMDEDSHGHALRWLTDEAPYPGSPDWGMGGGMTIEARDLYLAGASWERAEAEKTLKRSEVQLRMAFAQVIPVLDGGPARNAVQRARERLEQRLSDSRKRRAHLTEMSAPEGFIEKEDQLRRQIQYLLRAVTENEETLVAEIEADAGRAA